MPQSDLVVSGLIFAAVWATALILCDAPGAAVAVILAIASMLGYVAMRWWMKRRLEQ